MRDVDLYQQLLGLDSPWTVGRLELSVEGERVTGIDGLIPDPTLFGGGLRHYLSGALLGGPRNARDGASRRPLGLRDVRLHQIKRSAEDLVLPPAAPADAACRHCVRAAGVHVVLTGTGSIWHLVDIVTAISGDTHVGQ